MLRAPDSFEDEPVRNAHDVLIILESDDQSRSILEGVARALGCECVAADSTATAHELLSSRRPTIAVMAVERIDADCLAAFQAAAHRGIRPATLLVGAVNARGLASARRSAEARGLWIVGVARRPIDGNAAEQLLTQYLSAPPPIGRAELEQALAEHELTLQYQPKLAIASDTVKIQGVEALVRWQHPRRGLLAPRHFLPAVEAHGLMASLTDFVLAEAVRQAGRWRAGGLPLELVVNLSPKLVQDRAFPERLASLLIEHEFPSRQLVFDVTESASTQDRDLMLDVFTRLRVLGVGLSLDNFGTGLSSLTELYRLPFSEIKVDHSLIADVIREREARVIVQAIANLGKTLQLAVCAEGVETRQMLDYIQRVGFDSAQGRFFSDPAQAEDIERIVQVYPSFGPAATGSWRALNPVDIEGSGAAGHMFSPHNGEGKSST
jgi:EAL domain-containing protein (putative c-di-GMP-specific phosphodiesterase class I)